MEFLNLTQSIVRRSGQMDRQLQTITEELECSELHATSTYRAAGDIPLRQGSEGQVISSYLFIGRLLVLLRHLLS